MSRLIENFNLQRGLLRHIGSIPEVQILQRTKVVSIDHDSEARGGWPLIHLDNSQIIRARLLVRKVSSHSLTYLQLSVIGWRRRL